MGQFAIPVEALIRDVFQGVICGSLPLNLKGPPAAAEFAAGPFQNGNPLEMRTLQRSPCFPIDFPAWPNDLWMSLDSLSVLPVVVAFVLYFRWTSTTN